MLLLHLKWLTVVPIRLVNPSFDPIMLRKGTKIAQISAVLDCELITSIGSEQESHPIDTVTELPPEAKQALWKMIENSGETLNSHQQQELYTLLLMLLPLPGKDW